MRRVVRFAAPVIASFGVALHGGALFGAAPSPKPADAATARPALRDGPAPAFARRAAGVSSSATAAESVDEQPGALRLPPATALKIAERLYEAGDLDKAEPILEALQNASPADVDQTQVTFLLGMIAVQREEYAAGVEYFRSILDARPDLVRVRLELALALFAAKNDRAAAYHFRLALAEDLPPEAAEKARAFLAAIEARKVWRVNAQAGVAPDSNVSAGPKDRTVEIFGLPFELDDDARERSGLGFSSSLNAEVFPRLSERWRLELRGGGSFTDYENIQFDDLFLFGEVGPRFLSRGFSAGVVGTYSRRFFGGDGFSESVGGRISATFGLTKRTQLGLRFSGAHAKYDVAPERDGPVYSAGATLTRSLGRASSLQASATVTREQSNVEVLRNAQLLLRGSYARELPYGLTVAAGPDFYYRRFDNFDIVDGVERRDWTYGGSLFLTKRDWRIRGFAPIFSYQFLQNDSNADRFTYTRHRANLALTRTF